jgi:dihydroorotate dehydrogenase electron transfer subunit
MKINLNRITTFIKILIAFIILPCIALAQQTVITGKVTDVLPGIIETNQIDIIYSCGPMGMLEAINQIATELEVVHQCAVEEAMACGIGVCMTCVLPIRGDDGEIRMLRSCIDGPVVDGSSVIWNSKRQIPEGTWGAN